MKRFQKRVEDFTCTHCGREVSGDGYTNHCPACLQSRHVDINPGDRQSACGGLMEPVRLEGSGDFSIVHRCGVCGAEKRNKVSAQDDRAAILALASRGPLPSRDGSGMLGT